MCKGSALRKLMVASLPHQPVGISGQQDRNKPTKSPSADRSPLKIQ